MTRTHTIHILLLTSCFLLAQSIQTSVVIPGNQPSPSFSFPLHAQVTGPTTRTLYVGAATQGGQEFAIAGISTIKGDAFTALAPKTITLNDVKDQPNPLFNAPIAQLTLMTTDGFDPSEHLIALAESTPSTIYFFDRAQKALHSIKVPDTTKRETSGIVAVAASSQSCIFAAVKPAGQNSSFGAPGSGIALAFFGKMLPPKEDDSKKSKQPLRRTIRSKKDSSAPENNTTSESTPEKMSPDTKATQANTKVAQSDTKAISTTKATQSGTKNASSDSKKSSSEVLAETLEKIESALHLRSSAALALDRYSAKLRLGDTQAPIIINNNAVVMHWSPLLSRLFIGLQVEPGQAEGAVALITIHIGNEKDKYALTIDSIAPNTAFADNNNQIVGAIGSPTSIYEIKTVTTSTSLPYLIVRGGNGNSAATRNTVYALPLVNDRKDASTIGTIAATNSENNSVPATTPETMTTSNHPAAQVGGGLIIPGDISELSTQGDTVFASTTQGLFYSQALFDLNGKIKRWTQWQRYAGITNDLSNAIINTSQGGVITLTSTNNNTETVVSRTEWGKGTPEKTAPLITAIKSVEQIIDFPALSTPGLDHISIIATTYNSTLSLAQTGTVSNGGDSLSIQPTEGAVTHTTFTQGIITENLGASGEPAVVTLTGGILADISPITHVALARTPESSSGWIFVGGDRGLAVLSTPTHHGWTSLESGFKGLIEDMSFKMVGNYSYIKKLVIDGNFLYVLTDTSLDRIALTNSTFIPNEFEATRLAEVGQASFTQPNTFFNDLVVSDKLALIATQRGLFRVGNDRDITTALNAHKLDWTPVSIPDNFAGPIAHLYATSSTGRMQDSAKNGTDGHLYVLVSDRGRNRAQLNRFAIASVETDGITENTIQPLPDSFRSLAKIAKNKSYYTNFGEFRDVFGTDGAVAFHARGKEVIIVTNMQAVPNLFVNTGIQIGDNIPSLILNSASGTWFIGNEGGIHTNE